MKRLLRAFWALALTSMLGACDPSAAPSEADSTAKPSGFPVPPTLVMIEPGDLLSATATTPIRVWVDKDYEIVSDGFLANMAGSVVMVNLATSQPVEFSTQIVNPKKHGEAAFIQVIPTADLAPAWYAVALDKIPQGIVLSAAAATVPPVGKYAVRFNPASSPTPRLIRGCAKADGVVQVTLEFSESIVLPSGQDKAPVTIEMPAAGGDCQWLAATDQGSSKTGAVAIAKELAFRCAGNGEGTWRIKMEPGIKSPEGSAVRMLDGKETLDMPLDPQKGSGPDGCWIHRF